MEELAIQLGQYGLLLVFINVLLEQAGIPIPATPVLLLSGALAARGEMSASLVLLTAVSASLLADAAWFALGKRHGRRLLKKICRVSFNPDSCVGQTERMFDRYGVYSIAFAKLIPGFSTIAPPLAGAMGVGVIQFVVATTVGALLWAGGAVALGWGFHSTIAHVADWMESLGFWGLLLAGALLLCFVAFKWWQKRRLHRLLQVSRISPEELRSLLDAPVDMMVFDVRTDGGRRLDPRRIPGALVLHTEDSRRFDAKLAALPRNLEIVLYCT